MSKLANKECVPCSGKVPPLTSEEEQEYLEQLPGWDLLTDGEHRLQRSFKLKNFAEALQFTERVGELAEEIQHHPAILTEWGKVTVTWWTHKIRGLHENDFIMAARTDEAFRDLGFGSDQDK